MANRRAEINLGFLKALLVFCSAFACLLPKLHAQTYLVHCDIDGVVPVLNDKVIKTTPIEMEVQVIGKNIYFLVKEPKIYAMRVNSIETEKFLGTNLSNEVRIGARIKDRSAGLQSEITIDRKSAMVRGFHDVALKKNIVRINFQGPCVVP
jgi:hypothetical protein